MNRRSFIQGALAAVGAAVAGLRQQTEEEWVEPAESQYEITFDDLSATAAALVSRWPNRIIQVPVYDLTGLVGAMSFTEQEYEWFKLGWDRRSAVLLDAAGCPQWMIKEHCEPDYRWLRGELG